MTFPSIEQFRHVIRNVQYQAQYQGDDPDTGQPIMDREVQLPILQAHGTVKIHGTCAGVTLRDGKIQCFSRRQEITPTEDNAGFAKYVFANEDAFRKIFAQLNANIFRMDEGPVEIWGEWCGKGIQKGVAVCEIDKMFVVFGIRSEAGWYRLRDAPVEALEVPEARIFNVLRFGDFKVDIDFNDPKPARDLMESITQAVEAVCPVGAHFGVTGVGEGVVWQLPPYTSPKFWFKTKGEKHKVTSTKRLVEVDLEQAANIQDFVEATVTPQRLEQGWSILIADHWPISQASTGAFLKWVVNDVLKEESDRLEASGLEAKEVTKAISGKARKWWFELLNEQAGI